jgi:hypothetical protein
MSSLQTSSAILTPRTGILHRKQANPSGMTARLALDTQTRTDAFALRHKSYLAGDYIDRRPGDLFSDPNDDMPNTKTLVVYKDEEAIASVRMCILDTNPALQGWDDIPVAHVFPEEVDSLMAAANVDGKPVKAIEINRLVRHPDHMKDAELVFTLFRFVSFMVTYEKSDMTISCVRRNHMPFYKRFKFEHIAGPRSYPELKFETNLMVCPKSSYESLRNSVAMFNPKNVPADTYAGLFQGETVPVFKA